MELYEEILATKEKVMRETREGGELKELPCPFCQKPRSQRSDYIRCQPCGLNWLDGEDYSKNPHLSREPYLSHTKTTGRAVMETGDTA